MRGSRCERRIIGALLVAAIVLLQGCTALRFTYNNGTEIAYWWMDGYLDFDDAQEQQVRRATREWFDWHRREELPAYAALLQRAEAEVAADVTPEQICRWADDLRLRAERAFEHVVPAAAAFMVTATPVQLRALERKYEKNNREFRREYLQEQPEARREASLERAVDRAEMLYGTLAAPQRERLERGIAESPFDAGLWFDERQMRQQGVLAMMQRFAGKGPSAQADAEAALRAFAAEVRRSPREVYRLYAQRLQDYNCRLAAEVHNAAPPAQRQAGARKLHGWQVDVRALAAQAAARH